MGDEAEIGGDDYEVTVIGGGVIGISCAYHLARAGFSVRLLERGKIADGSSRENCGLISPSHALPLPRPGLILKAIRMMLRADSPLYVRPRLDWSTLSWFLQASRRCNIRDMREAMLGRQQLLDASRPMWNEMIEREGMDIEFEERGCIQVHARQDDMEGFEPTQALLDEIGLIATPLIGDDLQEFEPGLLPGLYGGWLYEMDAHMRPENLMVEWGRATRSLGVDIVEECEVTGFDSRGSVIESVQTPLGRISSKHFVLATGSWSPKLSKMLGFRLPIQPGKGYSITLERPEGCVSTPLILNEVSMAVTPWDSGLRLGGTMEFSGYDSKMRRSRVEALKRGARKYLKAPGKILIQEEWYGWRPMTPDGMPIIDYAPKHDNLVIAAGHNMQGMGMSPVTGTLVQQLISGEDAPMDVSYYSAKRF